MTSRADIWVTRPAAQATNLLAALEAAGWSAVAVPTLAIVAAADSDALQRQARGQLAAANAAVFISRNAVDWLWRVLGDDAAALLAGKRLLAVGPGTAATLRERGFNDVVMPDAGADSEALLARSELATPAGENIVIVRGRGGREKLATTLRERGAQVDYLEVYVRQHDETTQARLPQLWREQPPAAIVVSSRAGLDALRAMTPAEWQPRLRATPLICLGERLAATTAALGFRHCQAVAAGGGDAGIVAALRQSLAVGHE
ncbi:uroporphyrinogen-III synthase [Methylohalomonas lacus]|uniref:Uroporphyrinogen-III synthase n=1 Tax=Methylohalomonas lacus TaxID=398773 RepID=A0AAE3L430_9GAMM|nr:uroporphyrinogen-III synthase [Methylohalomonas lacus]MCS3903233.1 uroporphyrinogen-III synthase [Methylohalomonas lacus]